MRQLLPLFCASTLLSPTILAGQADKAITILKDQPATLRLSYEQYKLPDNYPSMGVLGAHALINLTPYWYGGVAFYGAVNGQSGGYFAMSLDGGLQHPIYKKLWLDVGGSIGAGGGRHSAVGGGFYVQPRAGLSYHFTYFDLGVNYSYVKFVDGNIDSHQWGATLSVPTNFSYANPALAGKTIHSAYGLALSRNYIALLANAYFPNKGTRSTSGHINDNTTQLIGMEAGHFFTQNWFIFGQAQGAYHGRSNGFADIQLGPGFKLPVAANGKLSVIAKVGLGSGGGGAVETAGGFIMQPTLGLEYRFNHNIAIEANGGYFTAPAGDFNNITAGLLLKYYFDKANPAAHNTDTIDQPLTYQGWRVRLLNQTYFSPRNDQGGINPNMQLMGLDIDRWLNHYFYATGQTAFAYDGRATGGYFSGMIGVGTQFSISHSNRYSLFAEALVGTAGGAGLDIGSGALYEPVVGCNVQINNYWGIQASVGRLMAYSGKFHSTTLNVGLSYSFATLD
ncbi:MAG: hypothetical protein P1U40_13480 [Coxiellaceae bacterium]|nr:hypothetical protein [Coxiellaceae bacterium]